VLASRVIPVLILDGGMVVETHQFSISNIIHTDPKGAVRAMGALEADELIILDVSRDKTNREAFYEALRGIADNSCCPITAGGWIDSLEEAKRIFECGADKIAINTAIKTNPGMVREIARVYGCQAIVASVDILGGRWKIDRGRVDAGLTRDAVAMSFEAGAGEMLLTSIAHEGGATGYDLLLIREVAEIVNIPIIAFGGVSRWEHLADGLKAGADACAFANVAHYSERSVRAAREFLKRRGAWVR
jgi:cyclase